MHHYKWFVLSLVIIFSAVAFVPVVAFPWMEKIDWQSFALAYTPPTVVFNVDTFADESDLVFNDFSCFTATGHCSLRAAISEANQLDNAYGDVIINLPAGTYSLIQTVMFQPNYHLQINRESNKRVVIQGVGPEKTIITGHRTVGLFKVKESVDFRDLSFENPYTYGSFAGALYIDWRSDIKLIRTILIASGGRSGAIHVQPNQTFLTLDQTSMMGNHSDFNGGAIMNLGGFVVIRNSTLYGNSANGLGGGIYSENGELIIENSTISENDSRANGGGLYIKGGKLSIYNSTIYGNEVWGNPVPGAALDLAVALSPQVYLSNSILYENPFYTYPTCGPEIGSTLNISSGGYNIIGTLGQCSINMGPEDKIGISPMINRIGQNSGLTQTNSLQPGSPAINGGNPTGCLDSNGQVLTVDQRLFPRPSRSIDSRCDVGAYEWDGWSQVFLPVIQR